MVKILRFNPTSQVAMKFCSAYSGRRELMRIMMQIVQSGYPPDNAVESRNSMNVGSLVHPIMDDGYIPSSHVVCSKGNVSNIFIHQCLLA